MKQAFLQLHLAVLLASCSGIFGNLISLDPVLITGYFVGFLFRYLRKSYFVGSSIDYGIPDAVGKCDAVTPFVHKVWQDYRW